MRLCVPIRVLNVRIMLISISTAVRIIVSVHPVLASILEKRQLWLLSRHSDQVCCHPHNRVIDRVAGVNVGCDGSACAIISVNPTEKVYESSLRTIASEALLLTLFRLFPFGFVARVEKCYQISSFQSKIMMYHAFPS